MDRAQPQARYFCKDAPPDAENVWGGSQVSDREVAVSALSVAWADLDADHRTALAQLRDLFRSGKDGRGMGDLNRLKPRGGVVGILGGALEDLRKFVERRKHVIQLPMIVVSEAGYASKQQREQCETEFTIYQVPVRRLGESAGGD